MKLSICCPSYNHEKYVGAFIRSLQAQTVSDWELVIVDDHSSDATIAKIGEFDDPRIRLIAHDWNRGINAGLADALSAATGEVCAFVASDDMLERDYVESVLKALAAQPERDFGFVQMSRIDGEGRKTGKILGVVNPAETDHLFARMFLDGDGFVSPGMFGRTEFFRKVFPLHYGVCQRQDQLLENLLAFYSDPIFIDRQLVCYRQCGQGVSTISPAVKARLAAEIPLTMDECAALFKTDADLCRHFGHLGVLPAAEVAPEDIPFWLGRIALLASEDERRHWGLGQIMNSFRDEKAQAALFERYGFTFADYMALLKNVRLPPSKLERRFKRLKLINKILVALLIAALLALFA